ncbi:MAG: hypothetical protein WB699_18465 [Bacteroidota bacterium]
MSSRLVEHGLSVVLVGLVFFALLSWQGNTQREERTARDAAVRPYLSMDSVDFANPYHRELFRETVEAFYPSRNDLGDSLLASIDAYRTEKFTNVAFKSGGARSMSAGDVWRIAWMYLQFVVVFVCSLLLTAFGGRAIAVCRFVIRKQGAGSAGLRILRRLIGADPKHPVRWVLALLASLGAVVAAFVFFSPAYVVAYALKGRMETNSEVFLLLLAVLTNGALINYADRYLLLLSAASKEGFVDTAIAKNLSTVWSWNTPQGIPWRSLLRPQHATPVHVFRHIALQAEFHHRTALKEHAAFLITGLIIIEMALNIQGQLGYELLQNILYGRYDIVATILFGMFLLIKATAFIIDLRADHDQKKYANAE